MRWGESRRVAGLDTRGLTGGGGVMNSATGASLFSNDFEPIYTSRVGAAVYCSLSPSITSNLESNLMHR